MKFSPILSVFLATLASVSPAAAQSTTDCGNFASISRGIYTVYNLMFGIPSSGSQCITANSLLNLVLNWSVQWTFAADGDEPISFPNAGHVRIAHQHTYYRPYIVPAIPGHRGGKTVYSFVSGTTQQTFAGDLKSFLTYLVNNQGLTNSRCVQSLGAGTETYVGSGLFNTTAYTATLVAL
ncbi:unnamed protein product [Parascedosporium putredinis]|uniref:Uncharacterized protein n=1 Tax=Parascedosporium putredinis TaxID=1442378 RepID=A0A9P1M727_9PEZI|nr:unnamed protein product [Parascedosporium putredinis]CAI7990789.1 unnamed protein product [Parascedosporium putredinis]